MAVQALCLVTCRGWPGDWGRNADCSCSLRDHVARCPVRKELGEVAHIQVLMVKSLSIGVAVMSGSQTGGERSPCPVTPGLALRYQYV